MHERIGESRCKLDEVRLTRNACFREHPMQMRLHRRLGDAERNRRLRHAADLDDRLQDPQLRRGQRERAVDEATLRAAVELRLPDEQGADG